MANTLSWGDISAHAELNEHAGIVSCENGSGILIEKDYLLNYTSSEDLLAVAEAATMGDKEILAFPSGPALYLAVCSVPELEESFYNLYRDNAQRKGKTFFPTTTVMHEAFMESIKDSFPSLYSTVQDSYLNGLINSSNRPGDNLSEEATKRLEDFKKAYPEAEDLSAKGDDFNFKEAYQALRLKYNQLREDFIQLATKYEFLIEQVKRLQEEVLITKNESLKAQKQAQKLEIEMAENKKATHDIYDELSRIKEYMSSRDDNFERIFEVPDESKASKKSTNPLQDEYDRRFNNIMSTDLSATKTGIEKFPHQFMCWMKKSLTDNPNRKDYAIQAAIKAHKEGYSSKHIKTAIDKFAPEAVNQPKGAYSEWVNNIALKSEQTKQTSR